MKKLSTIIFLICVLSFVPQAAAQTTTPKPTSTQTLSPTVSEKLTEKLNTQINKLKDKIASRVSELNLVEKRGITGVVSEVSSNKITLTDLSGNTKLIDIDEITKFSSSSAKSTFGLSDLAKGATINVLGLYNKQSKRILARFINTAVNPIFLTGTITKIDSKNFTINITTITSGKKTSSMVDISTATKLSSYSSGELTKIGFTKLRVGERAGIVGFPDKKDKSLLIASRIVVLPDAPKNPGIIIDEPSPTTAPTTTLRRATPATSASSGAKKATPTTSQ